MDIPGARAIVVVPGREDIEVTVDLHDWPVQGDTFPHTWNATVLRNLDLGPGEEIILFLIDENSALGHPCVVLSSAAGETRICAREEG